MADDPTRRKSEPKTKERDSERDADERTDSERVDDRKEREGADKRRDGPSSGESRTDDRVAAAQEAQHPSAESKREASASRGAARSRRSRSARLTEEQIDSPKRQTLVLLGIISVMTVALWVAAKAACNMRTQITRPRKVTVEQIVRTPKHAAMELQQRWAKGDFAGAQELASAAVAAELEKEKHACDSACVSARHAAAERTESTAYVVERDGNLTRVWVRTVGMDKGEQNYVLEVARDRASKQWEIIGRRPARSGEQPVRSAPPPAPAESAASLPDGGSATGTAVDASTSTSVPATAGSASGATSATRAGASMAPPGASASAPTSPPVGSARPQ